MTQEPTDLAYMAGMIDGEGTITIFVSDKRVRLILCVYNTCKEGIDWIHARFGGRARAVKRQRKDWKQSYVWETGWKHAADVLIAVRPYLVIKAAQADLFLTCTATMSRSYTRGVPEDIREKRLSIAKQIQYLNRKGSDGSVGLERCH